VYTLTLETRLRTETLLKAKAKGKAVM
jgi:hypothetical protein